jgi:hypothetical protein
MRAFGPTRDVLQPKAAVAGRPEAGQTGHVSAVG